jgi:hypothetical protein
VCVGGGGALLDLNENRKRSDTSNQEDAVRVTS